MWQGDLRRVFGVLNAAMMNSLFEAMIKFYGRKNHAWHSRFGDALEVRVAIHGPGREKSERAE